MRAIILGALCGAAFAATANAGDLYAPAGGYKDAYVSGPSWSGFYVGVNGGYGTGSWDGNMSFAAGACCAVGPLDKSTHSIDASGALAGGQIGYNRQVGSHLVAGVEADMDWSNISGKSGATLVPFPQGFPGNGEPYWGFGATNNWLSTVRGRLGYTVTPSLLLYATGGLAIGGFSETHVLGNPGNGACVGACPTASNDETKLGWTVGAGTEWALSNSWSTKLEYLYVSFTGLGGTMQWNNPALGAGTDGFKGDYNINTVKAGLNYHIGSIYEPLK